MNEPRLFIETYGQSDDVIIMVNGLGGSVSTYWPLVKVLSPDHKVITYDMAGSGRSAVPEGLAFGDHVQDLEALVSNLSASKVHLVGHSMGSIICQHYAQRHSEKVASITMLGGFTAPPDAARSALRERAAKAREQGMADIATAIATNGTAKDVQEHQPAAAAFVRESLLAQPPEGYALNCEALASVQAISLADLHCPILLITGDEDKTAPPDVARAMASQLERAELNIVQGCGHWPSIERARQVNYLLAKFHAFLRKG